ncbi:MAG: chorismate mutase [Spirochaetaceae bacterium]|jgi:chorismate mutase|nr:chorismate mutase [Spirochaetaceae bacterium]
MNEEGKILVTALRGAVCSSNDSAEMTQGVIELYDKLLESNGLAEKDLISLFFSLTPDLDAVNPATALRQSGRAGELAMMVFQEAAVSSSVPCTIRALIHCYMDRERPVKHVFFRGAEKLRPDWANA